MEFATDINADKIDLCFYEDGHKVGDYSLTQDEAIILTKKLMGSIAQQRVAVKLTCTAYKIKNRKAEL